MWTLTKYLLALLLLAAPCWGATVYWNSGYYESGASACSDVTAADTAGDVEAALTAAGASGTLYVCSNATGTEIDADSRLDTTADGQTIDGLAYDMVVGTLPTSGNSAHGGAVLDADGNSALTIIVKHDNVTIKNLAVTGATDKNISNLGWVKTGLTVENCELYGAQQGAEIDATNPGAGATYTGCWIHDNSHHGINGEEGIIASTVENCLIENNGTTGGGNYDGIVLAGVSGSAITGNYITGQKSTEGSGIDVCHGSVDVYRNMVVGGEGKGLTHCDDGTNTVWGNVFGSNNVGLIVYSNDGGTLNFWNNTITDSTSISMRLGLAVANSQTVDLKNNIVDGGTYSAYLEAGVTLTSDYNVLYGASTSDGFIAGTGARTFAQWQAAGYDTNSSNSDPQLATGTLKPGAWLIGTGLTDMQGETDINGNLYDPANPQMGAVWLDTPYGAEFGNAVISNVKIGDSPHVFAALYTPTESSGGLPYTLPFTLE
jgi:hypothetical protein